ncbi:MAG: hypothetical protein OFPI_06300 [Osedax symbiont Rs2]|nr:MAG: hypothetical protein OFPI_06300 [Osedax symbiont Rs2]
MRNINTSESGTTLIEVLITVLVISVGLLGMASLQLKAVTLNHSSYQRLQATNLAYDISDRIFINGAQAREGNYTIALGASAGLVTASDVTKADISDWLTMVATLPEGTFSIGAPQAMLGSPNNIRNYDITVCWSDSQNGLNAAQPACGNQNNRDFITFNASSKH